MSFGEVAAGPRLAGMASMTRAGTPAIAKDPLLNLGSGCVAYAAPDEFIDGPGFPAWPDLAETGAASCGRVGVRYVVPQADSPNAARSRRTANRMMRMGRNLPRISDCTKYLLSECVAGCNCISLHDAALNWIGLIRIVRRLGRWPSASNKPDMLDEDRHQSPRTKASKSKQALHTGGVRIRQCRRFGSESCCEESHDASAEPEEEKVASLPYCEWECQRNSASHHVCCSPENNASVSGSCRAEATGCAGNEGWVMPTPSPI